MLGAKRNCHPDVRPDVVTDINTSVCESVNSLPGRHKYVYKSITPSTWQFFWQELVDLMNCLRSVYKAKRNIVLELHFLSL